MVKKPASTKIKSATRTKAQQSAAVLSNMVLKKGEALTSRLPVVGKSAPRVIESVALMQASCLALRQRGVTVGLVPTMGALHQGHLALVAEAQKHCDVVVVSIFVNPTQFGPTEDFDRYPRDARGDVMKCQGAGVDLIFMPSGGDMYPEGFQTTVTLGPMTQGACGRYRPGHFQGVATVVNKLLNIVQPHVAVFGEKDWQQLQVIRRMVRDLNMPIDVVGLPTLRETDGLAMSSRNRNLSARDREQATALTTAIQAAQAAYKAGNQDVGVLATKAIEALKTFRGVKLQYVEIVDATSLEPLRYVDRPARILMAAHLGKVRLIDNGAVGPLT